MPVVHHFFGFWCPDGCHVAGSKAKVSANKITSIRSRYG